MPKHYRRLLTLLVALPVVMVVVALLYALGMESLEGRPRDFWTALTWSSETLTSVGYGADTHWDHPAMVIFVVTMQFVGVSLVFLVFPLLLVPFFEENFAGRLPRRRPAKLKDYVLIYRHGPAVTTLMEQLGRADVPTLVFEEDEETARRLVDRGHRVVVGRLADGDPDDDLILNARAMVVNGSDHDNGAFIIGARQLEFAGPILALVADPFHREPMTRAGATVVFTPQHILAAALAARASSQISPSVAGIQQLGRHLEVGELRVSLQSSLARKTLAAAEIRQRTGATIIGIWREGAFTALPGGDELLSAGTIVTAVGSEEGLRRLGELATPMTRVGPIIVIGHGEVGKKLVELLTDAGEIVRVVDRIAGPRIDVVGDALDREVLLRAGVEGAKAVIIALSSDSATLFATSILRDLSAEVPIIARVDRGENLARLHRAGADFALSLSNVAGQLLGFHLLGEEAITLEPRIKVVKTVAGALAGQTLAQAQIQRRSGASLVAVERGEQVLLDLDGGFTVLAGDALYACGAPEAIERFRTLLGPHA